MWKRLIIVSFIISITFAATNVTLPYFMLYLKGSLHKIVARFLPAEKVAVEVGVLTSAFMVTRVVVAFASGFIAEKIGRKRSIISGLILYLLSGLGLTTSMNFFHVVLWRAIQGVASAMVWPVAESLLVDIVPQGKTKALMFYTMAMNLGFIFGPVLGGVTLQAVSSMPLDLAVRVPFLWLPLGALFAIIIVIKLKDIPHKTSKIKELSSKIMGVLYVFFFNGFVNGIAAGMMMSVLIIYIMQYITSIPIELATLLASSGVLGMLMAVPLTRKMDKISFKKRFEVLIGSGILHKIVLMSLLLAKDFNSALVLLTLLNFSFSIAMPLMRSVQSDIIPKGVTAKVFGIQQSMFNLGMIIGPLFGSYLYEWFVKNRIDGGWVFVVAGLIGLVGILSFLTINKEELQGEIAASI